MKRIVSYMLFFTFLSIAAFAKYGFGPTGQTPVVTNTKEFVITVISSRMRKLLPNRQGEASDRCRYLLLEVKVENKTSKAHFISSGYFVAIVNAQTCEDESSVFWRTKCGLQTIKLQPGTHTIGFLCFEIPYAPKKIIIKYTDPSPSVIIKIPSLKN